MAETIEIEDEETFQNLIDTNAWLGDDVETRVIRLMQAGDLWLSQDPYQPNERHNDCLIAIKQALKARHGFEQIDQRDLLYACAPVALAHPDEVAVELYQSHNER